jgi:hypothetical protein
MAKCYYCKNNAKQVMVCNDWGNIPLCNDENCIKKFYKENTSQFFIEDISTWEDKDVIKEFGRNG